MFGTERQQRAQELESAVKKQLIVQELSWQEVGAFLSEMKDQKLYEELDFANFADWAESVDISRSLAYDLVAIQNSPYKELLFAVGVSKARLLLPKLVNASAEQAADLVNDVAELRWHDARQRLYGDDPELRIYMVKCPGCGRTLKASKSVTLEIGH